MSDKYEAKLPETPEEAEGMALTREYFAEEARRMDKHGTAKEFDLTALLLRKHAKFIKYDNLARRSWEEGFKAGESSVEVDWEMVLETWLDLNVDGPLDATKQIMDRYGIKPPWGEEKGKDEVIRFWKGLKDENREAHDLIYSRGPTTGNSDEP